MAMMDLSMRTNEAKLDIPEMPRPAAIKSRPSRASLPQEFREDMQARRIEMQKREKQKLSNAQSFALPLPPPPYEEAVPAPRELEAAETPKERKCGLRRWAKGFICALFVLALLLIVMALVEKDFEYDAPGIAAEADF